MAAARAISLVKTTTTHHNGGVTARCRTVQVVVPTAEMAVSNGAENQQDKSTSEKKKDMWDFSNSKKPTLAVSQHNCLLTG